MMIETESIPIFGQRQRYLQLKKVAEEMGVPLRKKIRFSDLPIGLDRFTIFQKKTFKRIKNIFKLQDPQVPGNLLLFDFTYTHKDDLEFKRTTILILNSVELDLPYFHLKPKNMMRKLGGLFVAETDDFERFPRFSKDYHVVGKDREAILYAIKPEVLEFLSEEKGWTIEGGGRFLLCYKKHKTQKPGQMIAFAEASLDLCNWMMNSQTNDFV